MVLGQLDNSYYLDRMWVQGRNTGHEFTLPETLKSRVKERGMGQSIGASFDDSK